MNIMQLVDELETVVSKSFRIPFTSNIVINEDDLFDILDQMRVSIPQEIKEAKRTEAERERILGRAQEEADRLVKMSKEKMLVAVDDHEVIEVARQEAREIVEQAHQESLQFKVESDNYVIDNLSGLEETLLKLLTTVQNGLSQVQRETDPQPLPVEPVEPVE